MKKVIIALLIAFVVLLYACNEENLVSPDNSVLTAELSKETNNITDIVFEDTSFKASVFYDGISGVDGIFPLRRNELLVVKEYGEGGIGVFKIGKGDTFSLEDAFSTLGNPFISPDNIIRLPNGTVFVSDGQAETVFKIGRHGGIPEPFVTKATTGSDLFNPYGLAIAPHNFRGPNVKPGDLIVADNAYSTDLRGVWAVNTSTGVAKIIAQGLVFTDGPILVAFNSKGKLYVFQNSGWGNGRLVKLSANGVVTPIIDVCILSSPSLAIHPITDELFLKLKEGKIHRLPKNSKTPVLFAANIGSFQDIAFNKTGTALYLGYRDYNQVIQITAKRKDW